MVLELRDVENEASKGMLVGNRMWRVKYLAIYIYIYVQNKRRVCFGGWCDFCGEMD